MEQFFNSARKIKREVKSKIMSIKFVKDTKTLSASQLQTLEAIAATQQIIENEKAAIRSKIEAVEREKHEEKLREQKVHFDNLREKEKKAEAEKLRKESAKNLEDSLRRQFFDANPNALESDFLRMKDSLKDEHFKKKMEGRETSETLIRKSSVFGGGTM